MPYRSTDNTDMSKLGGDKVDLYRIVDCWDPSSSWLSSGSSTTLIPYGSLDNGDRSMKDVSCLTDGDGSDFAAEPRGSGFSM
jgi:hypothetical protein